MRVYKPEWKDRSGERTTGAVYWVQFAVAGRLVRKSLKTKDKRVAQMRALQMVEREERKAVGLADPFEEHRERPLAEHVADFDVHLAARGVSKAHLDDRMLCLREYLDATKARTLVGLDFVEAQRWLGELAAGPLSARSVNKRLQALRQFGRWLVQARRHTHNPFEGLAMRNEATDRRRVRRAFTDDELDAFLDAARRRPLEEGSRKRTRSGLSEQVEAKFRRVGECRAFLYAFAAGTGLRRGELAGLTWADVDSGRATVTVRASVAKSKRMAELPLRSDLAAALSEQAARVRAHGLGTGPRDRVFPGPLFPTHGTVARDLAYAGLDGEDDQGRVLDLHSLRVTFISRLSAAGVHPRTTQALARHAKIDLTMRVYTDLRLLDLRGAVEGNSARPTALERTARARQGVGG
ncbi:MAG: site-specific integrase [Planctomycetes bacterium]|nr:site-specific integrase [Planctomycetota bacterium]